LVKIEQLDIDSKHENLSAFQEEMLTPLIQFKTLFPDEKACLSLLSEIKWKEGFECKKCGNTNYCSGKLPFSRRCTKCKKEESVTANTLFHRCKIPLNKAFEIAFLVCNVDDISSYKLSRRTDIRHMTCYHFQKKVLACKNDGEKDLLLDDLLQEVRLKISKLELQ
jgi:hypothetical protein